MDTAETPTVERVHGLYRTMLLIRAFDQYAGQARRDGKLRGSVHSYVGEEAIATGVCAEIATGAPLPDGADAVVPVEEFVALDTGRARVARAVRADENVRQSAAAASTSRARLSIQ